MNKNFTAPILSVLAAIGVVVSLTLIFIHGAGAHPGIDYITDPDSGRLVQTSLFFSQRILFFHVPFAFVLDTAVGVAGITSILFLWKRNPKMDDIAASATEVAVAFGAGVLVTGSIWAKAAWGCGGSGSRG